MFVPARAARWARQSMTAAAILLAAGIAVFQIALAAAPFPDSLFATRSPAWRITDREGRLLRVIRAGDDRIAFPGSLTKGGNRLLGQAVIAAEDKRFYRHRGVDVWAVVRAAWQNLSRGHIHSGASTITTQVVRLKEPAARRGFQAKVKEAFRAFQLERRFSKDQILGLYLDHAPFGGNLEGVRAGSLAYFDREPGDLSIAEAALLAGLPNAPSKLRPDRHPAQARKRRDAVLRRMRECGFVTDSELKTALAEPVRCRPGGRSFEAPHFCDFLQPGLPRGGEWRSTLDLRLQHTAEFCLREHAARWRDREIWGGAVAVIETKTGAVRAMVGSPDYADSVHAGQVNGALARRSPGSALKPLLYALAFDRGLATPDTMIPDVPATFQGYAPVNFDGVWRGMTTCRQALDQSLNMPALLLCRQVGLPDFIALLEKTGIVVREEGSAPPGLGLVIGDCRVRPLELANAFAVLARLGVWKPARLLEADPVSTGWRVFSPEACYLVADILGQDSRQMAFFGNCGEVVLPKVAWKTGTSSGFRDAWCVAWNPDYVVAVWVGNLDGRGTQGLTGQQAAVPVAADLFRRLVPDGGGSWYKVPAGVVRRTVCAVSGRAPNRDCPTSIAGLAIAGVSDPAPCAVHRRAPFSRATGERLALEQASGADAEWRVIEEWPPEVQDWRRRSGGGVGRQEGGSERGLLRIREPVAGRSYRRLDTAAGRPFGGLPLRATSDGGAGDLYWFVNGVFFKSSPAGRDLLLPWPSHGNVTVSCTDARGLRDEIAIQIE